jgi:RIO-like serine/threonine protein kinase
VLVRSYTEGRPLHQAECLPADFFEHLAELVRRVHARGVCHNDLHKEQNVLVRPDGRPALIDFQLASVHRRRGHAFDVRVHDDLRHVDKHARRYLRPGRGPGGVGAPAGPRPQRSLTALLWRRLVKPVYNLVTRLIPAARDGEARRPSSGPWPSWSAPLGPTRSGED